MVWTPYEMSNTDLFQYYLHGRVLISLEQLERITLTHAELLWEVELFPVDEYLIIDCNLNDAAFMQPCKTCHHISAGQFPTTCRTNCGGPFVMAKCQCIPTNFHYDLSSIEHVCDEINRHLRNWQSNQNRWKLPQDLVWQRLALWCRHRWPASVKWWTH